MRSCRFVLTLVLRLIACKFSLLTVRMFCTPRCRKKPRNTLTNDPPSIDIHNYGRWWNGIIGQDGPNAGILAQTWSQIAAHWKAESRVVGEPQATRPDDDV